MSGLKAISIEKLLENDKVAGIIDDISQEVRDRRNFIPPVCEVFSSPCTILTDEDRYNFSLDNEALEKLPNIIKNKKFGFGSNISGITNAAAF